MKPEDDGQDGPNDAILQPPGWRHAVHFYDNEDFLSGAVADFLADGLLMGEPVVMLASPARLDSVGRRMAASGVDVHEAQARRRLCWLDAAVTLDSIMVDRSPDRDRFEAQVGGLIRSVEPAAGRGRVRAYGELVDLLWRDGNPDAAIELEDMWNDLARRHDFALLCAYSKANVYRESRERRHHEICARHDHVIPAQSL